MELRQRVWEKPNRGFLKGNCNRNLGLMSCDYERRRFNYGCNNEHMKGYEDPVTTGDFVMYETMKLAADYCFSLIWLGFSRRGSRNLVL
jgi:hypothetical protein